MLFLIIPLLLLALVTVYFAWLGFPLSASLNAYQINWSWFEYFDIPLGLLFQLLILSGSVLLLFKRFFIALILLSMALALLLFMPWHAGFIHPDWLTNYVIESQQRQQLYYFTQEYFVPNIISEPTYIPTTQFETFFDQLGITFSMVSVGWYIALMTNLAILTVLLKYWQHSFQLTITLALIACFGLLPAYDSTLVLVKALKAQHQGNQHVGNARAYKALQSYKRALKLNPVLSYSTPFLLNVTDAYAMLTNERHPSSNISKAWIVIQQKKLFNTFSSSADSFRQARALLQEFNNSYIPVTALEKALYKFSHRLIIQLWINQGLAEYQRGHFHKAMQAFQQTPAVRNQLTASFYLATLYIKLNTPKPALELLHPYADKIAHPSVKADIYCTIGDAYTRAKDWLKAREAYLTCTKWDNTKNYRVTRALSGF